VLYAAFLLRYNSFAAGGSDSSGYLNAAHGMAAGRLAVRVMPLDTLHLDASWRDVFIPLGFAPSPEAGMIVPAYPTGYPLHLLIAGVVGGWSAAPFFVTPLMALLCLLVTYAVARELDLPEAYALAAGALLAVAPAFLMQAVQPMSDVTAVFWCTFALLCALRASRGARWAVLCGVAFGVAVWVRPSNLLLVPAIGIAMRWRVRPLAIAVAASLPLAIGVMILNKSMYGSPFLTGYGGVSGLFGWQFPLERVPLYSKWLAITETPLVFPAALLVAFDRRVVAWQRMLLAVWVAAFFVFYCFYFFTFNGSDDAWWYLRFLLPAFPALIVATMLLIRDFVPRRALAWTLIAAIAATGVRLAFFWGVHRLRDQEQTCPDAVHWAEGSLPPGALVASMQLSGSFYYYSGRFTARYDNLDPGLFALLRAQPGVAGLRWYAVVFDWEERRLTLQMPGRWTRLKSMRNVILLRLDP
jgi:4-amino-4-deoxy-L-arabinose transferase and related glycosyltransferases of PMT family